MNREQILANINRATEAIDAAREADDAQGIARATVDLAAAKSELEAHDAINRTAPAVTERTPARHLADADGVADFVERSASKTFGSVSIERGDIFTDPAGASGRLDIVTPDFGSGIDERGRQELTFLDLATVVPTTSDTVVFYKETGFTNSTSGVERRDGGDYGTFPQSSIAIAKVSAAVSKVGHHVRTDLDTLADQPAIEALLNTELPYGVRQEVQRQLLADADTTNGIASIAVTGVGRAQARGYDLGADEAELATNLIVAIRKAKTDARKVLYPATWVAVSPTAEEALQLARTGDGVFYGGNPFTGSGTSTIWGLRVVVCDALEDGIDETNPLGKVVVGNSATWRLRTRTGVEVSSSQDVASDFLADAVTMKARQRLAVENRRPEGIVVLLPTVEEEA